MERQRITSRLTGLAITIALGLVTTPATGQNTWHVPADFPAIQEAIEAASNGDEIIVAPGTYNEAINFGGKAVHLHSSDGPEVTIIDASGLNTSIVTCESGEGPNTILDGFTITGGNVTFGGGMRNLHSSPTIMNCTFEGNFGGGMANFVSSPTVTNCTFLGNSASYGGGMRNQGRSSPTVTNCTFLGNSAGVSGGGMHNDWNSGPVVTDCVFEANEAEISGGGIFSDVASQLPSIADTYFCNNVGCDVVGPWHDLGNNEFCDSGVESFLVPGDYATIQAAINAAACAAEIIVAPGTYNEAISFIGKPIHLRSSDGPEVTIIDATGVAQFVSVVTCETSEGPNTILDGFTITGGTGTDLFATAGGGMLNSNSSPTVMNCWFVDNTAWNGGGMYNTGDSNPVVINCHFKNNSAGFAGAIESAWGGTVQIADTIFCENTPSHISGPFDDLGGNEFFDVCPVDCPGDLSGPEGEPDGVVDVFDLIELINQWGPCADPADCPADLSGPTGEPDETVDVFDLIELINNWGPCP